MGIGITPVPLAELNNECEPEDDAGCELDPPLVAEAGAESDPVI